MLKKYVSVRNLVEISVSVSLGLYNIVSMIESLEI